VYRRRFRRRGLEVKQHGHLHTAAVFSAEFAIAAGQEPLSKIQARDGAFEPGFDCVGGSRGIWYLVRNQVDLLRTRISRMRLT